MEYIYNHIYTGAVTIAVVLTMSLFIFLQPNQKVSQDHSSLQLMEHESTMMPLMRSVTTITRYRVIGSIEQQLRSKIAEILEKNPWLTGRLTKARFSRDVQLQYKQSAQQDFQTMIDDHLLVIRDCELPAEPTYDEYMQAFHKYTVPRGNQSVNNRHSKLFLVTLVYIKNSDDVVVVFSLSHMIADGYTFYALQNMLDRSTPVTAMEVVRSTKYPSELLTLFGEKKANWHKSWFIPVGLVACALLQPRMRGYIVKVDKKWLDAQKAAYQKKRNTGRGDTGVDFVSTNDILTAWHNKIGGADVHIMAVNLRNRSAHFTDAMAGNYENSMLYNAPGDADTPEALRRSLLTVPHLSASNSVPGVLKTLAWNGSMVTNWTSFYKQVEYVATNDNATGENKASCEYKAHMPVMGANEMPIWKEFMCIFNLDADTIGLVLFTRALTEKDIEGTGVGVVLHTL